MNAKNGHFGPFWAIFDLQTGFMASKKIKKIALCYSIALGTFYTVAGMDFDFSIFWVRKKRLKV